MEKLRILIVEDDEAVAQGLADILNGSGYQAEWCEQPRKALEMVKRQPLDLVILDINLGEENGYAICKKIRETSEIPILFLTAYQSEIDVVRGFTVGGDDYITKPFRLQVLLARVQALLRRGKRAYGLRITSGELSYDMGRHQVCRDQSPPCPHPYRTAACAMPFAGLAPYAEPGKDIQRGLGQGQRLCR